MRRVGSRRGFPRRSAQGAPRRTGPRTCCLISRAPLRGLTSIMTTRSRGAGSLWERQPGAWELRIALGPAMDCLHESATERHRSLCGGRPTAHPGTVSGQAETVPPGPIPHCSPHDDQASPGSTAPSPQSFAGHALADQPAGGTAASASRRRAGRSDAGSSSAFNRACWGMWCQPSRCRARYRLVPSSQTPP